MISDLGRQIGVREAPCSTWKRKYVPRGVRELGTFTSRFSLSRQAFRIPGARVPMTLEDVTLRSFLLTDLPAILS